MAHKNKKGFTKVTDYLHYPQGDGKARTPFFKKVKCKQCGRRFKQSNRHEQACHVCLSEGIVNYIYHPDFRI